MQRDSFSSEFPIGSKMPDFELMNIDGEKLGSGYFADARVSLVVFTCNHCPYVKGSEDELLEVISRFSSDGLKSVWINSNDALQYPEDSFENMQAKVEQKGIKFPYLWDQTQQVAKSFDAACTPECYLFDSNKELIFHGTINNSPRDAAAVSESFLAKAIEQALEGQAPDPAFVHPLGCSIKWKN